MITQSDLVLLGLAFLIGYIQNNTGPQPYHYEKEIVIVDKNYQCPKNCGINHNHSVYYNSQQNGMVIDKSKLGKRVKKKKSRKKN